eukprot:TRINITY_DN25425_c0_g1_i1.p4 TRINITY_DN25425_c0_g1~~TRINITY_DN25425_c0_g1_i1.p4  ORF type:complete len:161 (+),score=17.56 TRINITY_DN25425_c0_g1_i1:34-483(+)
MCIRDRYNINFSLEEYDYLLQRISLDFDDKINLKEFLNAMLPRESFQFPTYRQQFDRNQVINNLVQNANEFNLSLTQKGLKKNTILFLKMQKIYFNQIPKCMQINNCQKKINYLKKKDYIRLKEFMIHERKVQLKSYQQQNQRKKFLLL